MFSGDESGLGVYAQRFESDGTPSGDRILVNDVQRDGDQLAPQVAVDVAGNFIVVWQANDDDGAGIFGQRYTTDGVVDGATFPINDVTVGDQQAPSVAMDNSGNALVSWQSLDPATGVERVFARRYDVSGTVEDTIPVNSVMAGNQTSPTVAVARGNGTFAIAWEGEVIGDETSIEIFAQRYSNGADPIGSEIQVNTETLRDQVTPDIAMDDDGDMVVTWTSEGIPGSGSDIFAQRLDSTGSFAGSEFRVNEAACKGSATPSWQWTTMATSS